jgi:hypothetical protein
MSQDSCPSAVSALFIQWCSRNSDLMKRGALLTEGACMQWLRLCQPDWSPFMVGSVQTAVARFWPSDSVGASTLEMAHDEAQKKFYVLGLHCLMSFTAYLHQAFHCFT